MSAPTPKQAKPKAPPRQSKVDMDPSELMRAMGGNGWYNPESNDMIRVLRHLAKRNAIPRPVLVMYGWMKWHTLTSDNRQPYANRNGVMLYLKDMSDDCAIEIHNLRTYWRMGAEIAIWRYGDAAKGENAEGLYLCAKVATVDEDEKPGEPSKGYVHTPREKFLQNFKPYIREKLEQLPPESFSHFASRWDRLEGIGNSAHADLFAAVRTVIGQDQDSLLRDVGIERKRLDNVKNKSEDELAEIAARKARIDGLLLPHVQKYVQTLEASVPTPESSLYAPEKGSVQTNENGTKNGGQNGAIPTSKQAVSKGASTAREKSASLLDLVKKSQTERRAGVSSGPVRASGSSPILDGKKSVQLHAGESRKLPESTTEERESAVILLAGIAALQQKHPKKFVGDEVTALSRADMTTALKMVRTVGIAEVPAFVLEIEQRAIDRALGHQLSIALISEIAGDFARGASKRERARREAEEQERKRQAFQAAAELNNKRDEELSERTEKVWEGLPLSGRMQRLRVAGEELKADPHLRSVYRNVTEAERRTQIEIRAKRTLRAEIEAEIA